MSEAAGEMGQQLGARTAFAGDHFQCPAPTLGASEPLVAPTPEASTYLGLH